MISSPQIEPTAAICYINFKKALRRLTSDQTGSSGLSDTEAVNIKGSTNPLDRLPTVPGRTASNDL